MRSYTPEEKAQAVALAAVLGPAKAAEQLGIPRRTVAYWTHLPAAAGPIAEAQAGIAERLTEAHREALEAVRASLADPKAKLGDKATALRVLGEQAALAEGRATARTESVALNLNVNTDRDSLTPEMHSQLGAWLHHLDALIDAGDIDAAEAEVLPVRRQERRIEGMIASGQAVDVTEAVALLQGSDDGLG